MSMLLKSIKIVSYCMAASLVVYALFFFAPLLFQIKPFVVLSGSMEPTFPVGSVVYSKKTNPETLRVGEAITFAKPQDAAQSVSERNGLGLGEVTHRIVKKDAATQTFITKGDANQVNDGTPVPYNAVIGKVVYHIDKAGFFVTKIQTREGKLVLSLYGVCCLLLLVLPDALGGGNRETSLE